MKKGVIYIIGGIGSYKNKKGETVPGVDLINITAQVKELGEVDEYIAVIDSPGGFVEVGYEIADYLKSLKKDVTTVINNQSASIATIISMAGKKGKRYIVKGSEFFVHNPFTTDTGDAASLAKTAEELQKIEDKMLATYMEATELTKEGISPLMKRETSLTAEDAVTHGFADKVITEDEAKAMGVELKSQAKSKAIAFIQTNTDIMTKFEEKAKTFMASLDAFADKMKLKFKAEVKILEVKTNDGKVLSVQTEEKDIRVNDVVSCEGKEISEKEFVLADGRKVKVNDKSTIIEIKSVENPTINETEYNKLKAEAEDLKAKVSALEKEKSDHEKTLTDLQGKFAFLAKHVESTHEPEIVNGKFRKVNEEESDIVALAEQMKKESREEKAKSFKTN